MQRVRNIIDTMEEQAKVIYGEKKAAFLRGDDSIKHMVGEGKDIISTLRASISFEFLSDRPF